MLSLPPGFSPEDGGIDPAGMAARRAAAGADPGLVCWSDIGGRCHAAVVLSPDASVTGPMLVHLGLLGLYDALAVLAPPQVPIDVVEGDAGEGGVVLVDGGRAGWVRAVLAEDLGWAVLEIEVAIGAAGPQHAAGAMAEEPGLAPEETCLMEEGFGALDAASVLEPFCRHLKAWVDAWEDIGAEGLARAVADRAHGRALGLEARA